MTLLGMSKNLFLITNLVEELKSPLGHPTILNTNPCQDVHQIIGLINIDLFCSKVSKTFTVSKLRLKNDILAIISFVQYTATIQIITHSKTTVTVKKGESENLLEIFVFLSYYKYSNFIRIV